MNQATNPYQEILNNQRTHFLNTRIENTIWERKKKLKSIKRWIKTNEELIITELAKDFGKCPEEITISEIKPIIGEINDALRNIRYWSQNEFKKTPIFLLGSSAKVIKEPKGVALIIAPWNFPFMLAIGPLVSAITAGCNAVVKPSENTPHCEKLIQKLISEVFKTEEVACVTGGVQETTDLLALKWDHIFFTGSPIVGKIVMAAAAKHLTSVTLELGGQNPVLIDKNANLKDAAQKLIWGKFFNCGQSCISPNYVLVHKSVLPKFEEILKTQYLKTFGDKEATKANVTFARIVNKQHFERVKNLLNKSIDEGAKLVIGGDTETDINYVDPTIITGTTKDSTIFNEEIFGPILPLMTYENVDDAIALINSQEKALALYVFTKSNGFANNVIKKTTAGTTVINDTTIQFSHPNLPFGGVNNSGIGKAHGVYGYREFVNERAVMKQRIGLTAPKMIYPPYNGFKRLVIKAVTWWFN